MVPVVPGEVPTAVSRGYPARFPAQEPPRATRENLREIYRVSYIVICTTLPSTERITLFGRHDTTSIDQNEEIIMLIK